MFDADPWDSLISFAPGIPMARGGTLELTFAPGVDVATQSGRTIDLFDWTGVTPTGSFAVESQYIWDVSNLYTSGEVKFLAASGLAGDFNNDNVVDGADYVAWRKGLGTIYTQSAYNVWRAHFGRASSEGWSAGSGSATSANAAVPEPSTFVLLMFAAAGLCLRSRRKNAPANQPFPALPAAAGPGELQSRGLVHFSASQLQAFRASVGRKDGPAPFALDFAVLPAAGRVLFTFGSHLS